MFIKLVLFAVLVVLSGIDYHTTTIIIRDPGTFTPEVNPILRELILYTSSLEAILVLKLVALGLILGLLKKISASILFCLCIPYAVICGMSLSAIYEVML